MSTYRDTPRGTTAEEVLAGEVAKVRREHDSLRSTVLPRTGGNATSFARLGDTVDATAQLGIGSTFTSVVQLAVNHGAGRATILGWAQAQKKTAAGEMAIEIWDVTAGVRIGETAPFDQVADGWIAPFVIANHSPGAGARTYQVRMRATTGTVNKAAARLVVLEG